MLGKTPDFALVNGEGEKSRFVCWGVFGGPCGLKDFLLGGSFEVVIVILPIGWGDFVSGDCRESVVAVKLDPVPSVKMSTDASLCPALLEISMAGAAK